MALPELIFELENGAHAPSRAHEDDAGLDLYANEDAVLAFGSPTFIHTGVHMLIPSGYVGLICPRSGLTKKGKVAEIGVVDAGYTGEIGVTMRYMNSSINDKGGMYVKTSMIEKGDRIAQILILPVQAVMLKAGNVQEVNTARGGNGWGSSGR